MPRPKISLSSLCWLSVVASLILTLAIEERQYPARMARMEKEAQETIQGLAGELYRCRGRTVSPRSFRPNTAIPARFDWKVNGSPIPEWAEEPGAAAGAIKKRPLGRKENRPDHMPTPGVEGDCPECY